jgi:hypothetical protein
MTPLALSRGSDRRPNPIETAPEDDRSSRNAIVRFAELELASRAALPILCTAVDHGQRLTLPLLATTREAAQCTETPAMT